MPRIGLGWSVEDLLLQQNCPERRLIVSKSGRYDRKFSDWEEPARVSGD